MAAFAQQWQSCYSYSMVHKPEIFTTAFYRTLPTCALDSYECPDTLAHALVLASSMGSPPASLIRVQTVFLLRPISALVFISRHQLPHSTETLWPICGIRTMGLWRASKFRLSIVSIHHGHWTLNGFAFKNQYDISKTKQKNYMNSAPFPLKICF